MLVFATEFPVKPTTTTRDFLEAVRVWILGSRHTALVPADLATMGESAEWSMPAGPESVDVLLVQNEEEAAAARYVRFHDNLEWTTTVVFRKRGSGAWITLRTACESEYPQTRLPIPKKPVLIRMLMERLGTGKDGVLVAQHAPHHLSDYDIDLAAALLNGAAGCRLPVVYVSVRFDGTHGVNDQAMARDLAGMAHVVVEPNRPFSQRLRISVGCNNVYGGTVGVYWPDASGRRTFYIGQETQSPQEIKGAVCDEVRSALVNRRTLEECTWSAVQGLVLRQKIAQLKATDSNEVQSYIDTFERELIAVREEKAQADNEVWRLGAELRRQQASGTRRIDKGAMQIGEQDFYQGEVLGIIRDAVKDARDRVPNDSRRQHVLDAFLEATPPTDEANKNRERLKATLRGYKSLDKKTSRALEELGFTITDDGKHFKLVFQDDDRYTFTLPKSGSDRRGGLNAVRDIGKLLF